MMDEQDTEAQLRSALTMARTALRHAVGDQATAAVSAASAGDFVDDDAAFYATALAKADDALRGMGS